jgi:Tfp pilus assembly protein PilV
MAGKGDTFENDWLKLIFNATPIANIADNAATSPLTNLYVALHTADPGEAGTQATSEVSYTGYARATVARTSGGWTVTNNSVSPAATISFGACTAGTATATHASVGVAVSGSSKILYAGALTPNISISSGVTPQIPTSSTITED